MLHINYLAIAVATLGAFIFSAIYYTLLNKQVQAARAAKSGRQEKTPGMTPNKMIIEIVRTFIVGLVMAYAVINARNLADAALVVFWLWLAFPVVLLVGSVIHENFPVKLAVIHAFDWFVKLSLFAVVLTLWR
jgi:hypothetical protein